MSKLVSFSIFFAIWVVMSGKFDLFHLSMGAGSSMLVVWLSHDLLFKDSKGFKESLLEFFRFLRYLVWLFWQIVLANIHIAHLALSPRAMEQIDPRLVSFKTVLKTDFARFVFANSITLTPGTVTVRIQDDTFFVHAITPHSVGDLDGEGASEMERWVAWVFEGGKR